MKTVLNNIKTIAFFGIVLIFASCQKDKTTYPPDTAYQKNGNLMVNKSIDQTNTERILLKENLIPIENNKSVTKITDNEFTFDPTENYVFKLQAEVSSPQYQGNTLQATHVTIHENYAFVTYNTKGDKWQGGFEIFNVTNIQNPELIVSAIMPDGDISAIDYNDGKVYLAGAMGSNNETDLESPAFLQVVNLDNQMNIISVDTILDISSYVATDVLATDKYILVTSGSDGGLTVFDKFTYEPVNISQYANARALDANSGNVFMLQGEPGQINKLNKATFGAEAVFSVDGANTPASKSEIAVNENYVLSALNEGGLKMLTTTGILKQHIPKPSVPQGAIADNYVTNSVTLNENLVLIGNGAAGVHVGNIINTLNDTIWMLGAMDFEGDASTNFVESKGQVIFVATGLEGLKILSVHIDEGLPDDISVTTPCETIIDDISEMFPEQMDITSTYPSIFNDTAHLSVYIEEETHLYLTFIDEGAGWKNTLGYYTYPANNPPASVDEIEKKVIFPNISKESEGGGLNYGDMVKINDEPFQPGTIVGFYLVAKGYNNGVLTNGEYIHYSDTRFNIGQKQQSTLFVTENCNELVLTFEDVTKTSNFYTIIIST